MHKNAPDVRPVNSTWWEAVTHRDAGAAGTFVYGVVTTGIYCRPGCPSRLPNRRNVRFFETWQGAEAAGFRACKRCSPRSPDARDAATAAVVAACRTIETADQEPSLQDLADAAGFSPYHFQRLFKRIVGVSPKHYAAEVRLDRVRDGLHAEATVTGAIYDAGYASSSRFYAAAPAALGMTPSTYRQGGQGVSIRYAVTESYLGWVLVAATDRGICRIDLGETPEALKARLEADFPEADLGPGGPAFDAVVAQVVALLEAPERGLALPLDIQGTAFQRRVWAALQEIPAGATASYGEIAARIGEPQAARAVAQACAHNTLAVAIPCHRVVRSDGSLGGYRWGLDRKAALLEREAED
jgi:AraC family transcriptional regulator of adaptative response/methylated-DNA-[protein]-cysteine methyltransferase